MRIITGRSKRHWRKFHEMPKRVYAKDPLYVPQVRQDIESLFEGAPEERWTIVLVEKFGKIEGRAIAFVQKGDRAKAGIGFVDFTDDDLVSSVLFEACMDFLAPFNCETVQAPVNFGERDKFWGLRIGGIGGPSYQENYNPQYCEKHFLDYGFERAFEQITLELTLDEFNTQRFAKLETRLRRKGIRIEPFSYARRQEFSDDFVSIYNSAWWEHEHFQPLTKERVLLLMSRMKPILREELMLFAYDGDKPIGFFLSVIELNQIMKHLDGNMNWWGMLCFLFWKWRTPIRWAKGMVFGIIPEYQGKGVGACLVMEMYRVMREDGHLNALELSWIGDFNDRMNRFIHALGAREIKRHATYSKNF